MKMNIRFTDNKRSFLAQSIVVNNNVVYGFISKYSNGDVNFDDSDKMFFDWLYRSMIHQNIFRDIYNNYQSNTKEHSGSAVSIFLLHSNNNEISEFINIFLQHLNLSNNLKFYSKYKDIKNGLQLTKYNYGTFPIGNLKYIKNNSHDENIIGDINYLLTLFNNVNKSNLNYKVRNRIYGDIISHSRILLDNVYSYISYKLNGNRLNMQKSSQNKIDKINNYLHVNKNRQKEISEIIEELNTKINTDNQKSNIGKLYTGRNELVHGLKDIMKNIETNNGFNNIINGINDIDNGLKSIRNIKGTVHNTNIFPSKEEAIFYLNITTTFSRYLIYKLNIKLK